MKKDERSIDYKTCIDVHRKCNSKYVSFGKQHFERAELFQLQYKMFIKKKLKKKIMKLQC